MLAVLRRVVPALLAAFTLSCAASHPDLPVVHTLRFEGVKQVSEGDLRARIVTTEPFWLTGWLPEWFPFADRKYFEPNAWRTDLRRVERYYQARGFYQAKVVSSEVKPNGKSVDLRVVVDEGKPTHVTGMEIQGLEKLPSPQQRKVVTKLPIRVGAPFQEDDWSELKEKVPERLRELGYAKASAAGEARVDVVRQTAQLRLQVDPGQRFRLGEIQVKQQPNARVPAWRIAEQAEATATPGHWYSDQALADAQNRVNRMGVFGAVKVSPGTPDEDDATLPVVVDVREAPFHSLRLGGGIGVDPVRQEARARADYTDRDFLGGLRNLTLTARAGYAFIPSVVAVVGNIQGTSPKSAPFYTLSGTLEQPHFLARDLRLNVQVETSSNIEQAYQFIGGDARARLIWQPHPQLVVRTSYNFEAYRLWGESSLVGFNGQAAAPLLTYGCQSTPCNQFLSYLEEAIEWDRRDNALHPRRGYYLGLSVQEGGGPLGGSYTYLRIQPDARYFQPLGPRLTLAARARAGTLIPLSNQVSPIVARFFAGGANSMRGFGTNRLSPLQAVANPSNVTSPSSLASPFGTLPGYTYGDVYGLTVPIGGNGLFEASIELRYEITQNLIFSVFADSGMVTAESFGKTPAGTSYFGNMQYALGFGFRYLTPVGPIRVDLAHRLNVGPPLPVIQPGGPTVAYPTQGTCFGFFDHGGHHIAGAPEGPCAFHISFGEAF